MSNELGTTGKPGPAPTITESVRSLFEQSVETVDTIKTRAGEVTDQVKQAGARTTTYIQAKPFKSVVIAFTVGYIAMRLRTSPLVKLGLIAGLGYLGTRFVRH